MKEINLLRVPATISVFKTLVDGGLSLKVTTAELTPDDALVLLRLKGKQGYMVFKETKVEEKDIADLPDIIKEFDEKKTPSQRLRSRMFVYFKGKHKTDKGFNTWYVDSLNEIGQKYLDKLQ